ncbi:formimidoylglutamase [Aureibaculum marinum]|nr:formimidoylglutamase [Aureibaculum marinum]
MNLQIQYFKTEEINSLISFRNSEKKLGEKLLISKDSNLTHFNGKFVILGIPEDIGIKANKGIGGASSTFNTFLKAFVNTQNTANLDGNEFLLLGHIGTEHLMKKSLNADINTLRNLTEKLDNLVFPVIQHIVKHGKIPIVIGGGHNNAFPILKGCSIALNAPINTINLDAHSDFRIVEGRHSGNGFRYAYNAKYLKKYAILGLHEAYNSQNIIEELSRNPDFLPIFFEDVFLRNKETWEEAQCRALTFVKDNKFGVELDLDSLQNTLSSAWTPVGISTLQTLNYLYTCGKEKQVCYLHLTEAIAERTDGFKNPLVGKLLSYLVQSFCKGVLEN